MTDASNARVSYADLLVRLTDLPALARPPVEGERTAAARYLRREGSWIVAFDAVDPGVFWRIWSALPGDGHVRILAASPTER